MGADISRLLPAVQYKLRLVAYYYTGRITLARKKPRQPPQKIIAPYLFHELEQDIQFQPLILKAVLQATVIPRIGIYRHPVLRVIRGGSSAAIFGNKPVQSRGRVYPR